MEDVFTLLLAVLLAGGPVWTASLDERTAKAFVTIRIYNSFGVPVEDLMAARAEADAILREAGIEPVWLHCPVIEARRRSSNPSMHLYGASQPPGESTISLGYRHRSGSTAPLAPPAQVDSGRRSRCDSEVGRGELVVRILGSSHLDTASGRAPLGEALVHRQFHTGSFATVFADRVASTADRAGANSRGVLGRVIAHEIGHLLLGTRDHAMHGLMRGNWTDRELRRPIGLEWHFSASEARRMRARCASPRPSGVEPN